MAQFVFGIYCLLLTTFIAVVFFGKVRENNRETKIYEKMLILGIVESALHCFLFYAARIEILPIRDFFLKTYLVIVVMWSLFLADYVILICFPKVSNKLLSFHFAGVTVLMAIVFAILPIYDAAGDQFDDVYSYGPSVDALFVFAYIYASVFLVLVIAFCRKNRIKKFAPIISFLVLSLAVGIFQKIRPDVIVSTSTHVFVTVMLYFTIENPDVVMIAKLEEAKNIADKANNAKSDFLASMSHEISTPLNAIVGLCHDLKSYSSAIPKEAAEDVDDIVEASNILVEIVGNILDINKIEQGKVDIVNASYDFKHEITTMANVTATRIGDKPIKFVINFPEDFPRYLIGDKGHVKTVVNNLLSNAFKYTAEGVVFLEISTAVEGDIVHLTITVSDTGMGIKPEAQKVLFDKFERFDKEKNQDIEGTGLGLAITKSLVEMMGGTISVTSIVDRGSTFKIRLDQQIDVERNKRAESEENVSEEERAERIFKKIGPKSVLVVDDNSINRKVVKTMLKNAEFSFSEASSGRECYDIVHAGGKFDIIFMDIMMPEMSGCDTLKLLKEIPGFTTPVVALSADAIGSAEADYIKAGFSAYIPKPFTEDMMVQTLEKLL